MIYLDLFLGFLKVGLFSFGGAYAAIPLIRDVVLKHGWMSDEALSYMIAVSGYWYLGEHGAVLPAAALLPGRHFRAAPRGKGRAFGKTERGTFPAPPSENDAARRGAKERSS